MEPKKSVTPSVALAVAGFDPSSGAGISADLNVFSAHKIYGVAAITALTIQSTQGVRRVEPVSAHTLRETLDCLADDVAIEGVKIGMLGTAEIAAQLAAWLRGANIRRERVVLDPVLRSSSGKALLDEGGIELVRSELLPIVGWITPNLDELEVLTGSPMRDRDTLPEAARKLAGLAPGLNAVVTGGHLDPPDDFLLTASREEFWFPGQRVETTSTHGTGCAFSSALLCRVMAGDAPAEAVRAAKEFVTRALETAVPVGKGRGPAIVFGCSRNG